MRKARSLYTELSFQLYVLLSIDLAHSCASMCKRNGKEHVPYHWNLNAVYRLFAFRIVSDNIACIAAGMISIDILVKERELVCACHSPVSPIKNHAMVQEESTVLWQLM